MSIVASALTRPGRARAAAGRAAPRGAEHGSTGYTHARRRTETTASDSILRLQLVRKVNDKHAACWRPRVLCPVLVRFTVTFGLMLCLMHLGNVWCRAVDSCANCCGAVTCAYSRDRPAHQRQGRWRRNALIAGTQAPAIAFRGQSALVRPFEVPTGMPSAQCAPCPCSS